MSKYMGNVIRSLQNDQHAFLESPTGTGKTLSLLCATLAWIEQQKSANRKPPLVIYASRTHSQIKQAMNEMKRSAYRHMQAAVMASRQHLCINDNLKELTYKKKIETCKSLRENTSENCLFYENLATGLHSFSEGIMDIEDLVRKGKQMECCSHFAAKEIVDRDPDILFMPYNYLLDPKIRFVVKGLKNKPIIIFDEAHNVSKICEEMASTQLTSKKVSNALIDINYIIGKTQFTFESNPDVIEEFNSRQSLKSSLQMLKSEIDGIKVNDKKNGKSHPADYMFQLLQKANINEENISSIHETLKKSVTYLTENADIDEEEDEENDDEDYIPNGSGLRSLNTFLSIVFSSYVDSLREKVKECFHVHIECQTKKRQSNEQPSHDVETNKINFWCFSPLFGMHYLLTRARNLILTSGTLSPLDSLIAEMEIENPIKFISKHVIEPEQIFIKVISRGSDGVKLDSSYANRENNEYRLSLGKTIIEFARVVPDGMLIFFPSYTVMNDFTDFWKEKEIWQLIESEKPIFMEEREKIQSKIQAYYATIDSPNSKGAIFMAVMRGKVSEGLDFADKYGRAVIVTGIPLPPCMDPKIILKKRYQDKNRTDRLNKMLSGNEWYNLDGMKACNQSIGRIIRHKNDYGVILLCDKRFNDSSYAKYITAWIRNQLNVNRKPASFHEVIQQLEIFYEKSEKALPISKQKLRPEVKLSDEEIDEESDEVCRKLEFEGTWGAGDRKLKKDISLRRHSLTETQDDNLPGTSNSIVTIKSSQRKRKCIEYFFRR